jgi:hypothetical protein
LLEPQDSERYYERDFHKALEFFEKSVKMEPNLKDFPNEPNRPNPSKRFIEMCKAYVENPPGEDWDGVTRLMSK